MSKYSSRGTPNRQRHMAEEAHRAGFTWVTESHVKQFLSRGPNQFTRPVATGNAQTSANVAAKIDARNPVKTGKAVSKQTVAIEAATAPVADADIDAAIIASVIAEYATRGKAYNAEHFAKCVRAANAGEEAFRAYFATLSAGLNGPRGKVMALMGASRGWDIA